MCGACCCEQGSPPCIDEDVAAMPPEIAAIINWFSAMDAYRYDYKKPCYFLSSDNKCLIWPYRPQACREFEAGVDCPDTKATKWMSNFEEQLRAAESKTVTAHMIEFRLALRAFWRLVISTWQDDMSRSFKIMKCLWHQWRRKK